LMNLKHSLHTIFIRAAGVQKTKSCVFTLMNNMNVDTLLFVTDLRLDLASHTIIADGYVLSLTLDITHSILDILGGIHDAAVHVKMFGEELKAWKQILPVFAERCRQWKHKDSCEYLLKGVVPLSEESDEDPLCSCGRGKDIDGFSKFNKWKKLAPFITKIALGPLFAVSCLESVDGFIRNKGLSLPGMDSRAQEIQRKCAACGGPGKPNLLLCGKCKKVMYCSAACQSKDWKALHKSRCKRSAV